jgi:hypothetical protein
MTDEVLRGTWYRSFEEEQAGAPELVYRPSGYAFPRSRAPRPALRFGPDGDVAAFGAGPDDRSVPLGEAPPFTVVSAEPDRLVIREEDKK